MESKHCYNLNEPFEYDMSDFPDSVEERYMDILIDQLHDIAENYLNEYEKKLYNLNLDKKLFSINLFSKISN